MRVLITGITGFVGKHLARHLALEPGVVVGGLAAGAARDDGGTHIRSVDVTDRAELRRAVAEFAPDAIVHLAGLAHVGASWQRPGDYLRVNFEGTRNILEAAQGCRLLLASSAEVYGTVPDEQQPIREEQPVAPRSPYAMTKACAEVLALDAGAIVARSFNSIGPGQSRQFALASFAWQLAEIHAGRQAPTIEVGDLSPRRDFMHVEDTARAYGHLLRHGRAGEIYNLATGRGASIGDALERLRQVAGVVAEIRQDPSRLRKVDVPTLVGDTTKLHGLGWEPVHSLDDALRDLWAATLAEAS